MWKKIDKRKKISLLHRSRTGRSAILFGGFAPQNILWLGWVSKCTSGGDRCIKDDMPGHRALVRPSCLATFNSLDVWCFVSRWVGYVSVFLVWLVCFLFSYAFIFSIFFPIFFLCILKIFYFCWLFCTWIAPFLFGLSPFLFGITPFLNGIYPFLLGLLLFWLELLLF